MKLRNKIHQDGKWYCEFIKLKDILNEKDFNMLCYFIEEDEISDAYKIVNKFAPSFTSVLTMYLIKEHFSPFKFNPLHNMEYVPELFLYEAFAEDEVVCVNDSISEIKDNAFAFCKLKRLIISKSVQYIGDNALCINAGEIYYEGTKQDFIDKFLGKSKCFARTRGQVINCTDGEIEIKK